MAAVGQDFTDACAGTFPQIAEEQLNLDALLALLEGDEFAFTVPGFCPCHVCDHIAARIVSDPKVGAYVVEPKFLRRGTSFYDAAKDHRLLDQYFAEAARDMQELRDLCSPFRSPIDELHCRLDELWPWGATVATLDGRKMKAGTARLCTNGGGAKAHVDSLGFDAKAFKDGPVLRTQVSANIYLSLPERGGALALWETRIVTEEEEAIFRLPTSKYGLDEDKLGPPALTICPQQGQLVVFDSNHPHAVRPSFGGFRVTMALFVGYGGPGKPLYLWN